VKRTLWFTFVLVLFSHALAAQGVVAQGAPATTSDARAWPIKVVFGGAQIDPRSIRTLTISDQVTAILGAGSAVIGHVVVDTAPTTAVTQSGTWTLRVFDQSGSGVNSTANALWQVIRDAAGNARGANVTAANALVVDGSAVTQPVSGPLTDTQLRAVAVPVSGTVTATGPLTDTQLRATPVSVSGTVTATGPLTDTQLRATPVPVSGTVTATGPLTDTQLRATAVPVSGTFFQVTQPVSGTVTATQGTATNLKTQAEAYQGGAAVAAANPLLVSLANTGANATAVKIDGSAVTQPISAVSLPLPTNASQEHTTAASPTSTRLSDGAAFYNALKPADTLTKVATVDTITNALPAGANVIGHVINDTGSTTAVTGNVTVVQPTGSNLHIQCDSGCSTAALSAVATESNVSASASNVTVLALNAARKGAVIYNDSGSYLYLKLGATSSATSFTNKVAPGQSFQLPVNGYTGIIDGIWDVADGTARVTEW
jgi:hypothetical protein